MILVLTDTESKIILSPDGLANVCPGEEFTLTCSTDQADFVKWNVQNTITSSFSRSWLISNSGTSVMLNLSIAEDPNAFSISRNSEPESLPLISSLTITNVTTSWNGTVVNCTEAGDAVTESNRSVAAATIQVITSDIGTYARKICSLVRTHCYCNCLLVAVAHNPYIVIKFTAACSRE